MGDPLSDILALTHAQSVITGGLYAGGPWRLRFRPPKQVKLYAIGKGACWLAIDGHHAPVRLEAGDVALLTAKRSFVLASDLAAKTAEAYPLFTRSPDGFATLGDGEDFIMLGGHVSLHPVKGSLLLDALPPLVHVHGPSREASAVEQLLGQLVEEVRGDRAGTRLASTLLTQLIILRVLRAYLEDVGAKATGWLGALGDEGLGPALKLMHGDPAHPWQLEELARAVGMSRTTFALRFKTAVGVAPLSYLFDWRMHLAERALRETDTPVSRVGLSIGYTSESAFTNAFKRAVGMAPRRYRQLVDRADGQA
jgi:AraC-like DNA-binding protein